MDIKKLFPIPDINKSKRILCIQPHCDDMELTCGATLAKLSAAGTEVIYLTVTDGAAGFSNSDSYEDRMNTRKNEQKSAGKLLGVKKYYWLDFPDAGDWSQYDCRVKIINMLRQIKPDFVITVDPWMKYEAHMDHIKTGLATAEALILYNYSGFSDEDDEFIPFAIDALAVAIGNSHGKYKGIPKLDFERLDAINKEAGVPLVLHGGSGIPDDDFRKAITLGISKINFYTGMSQAALKTMTESVSNLSDKYDDYVLIKEKIKSSISKTVEEQMNIFGSINKAQNKQITRTIKQLIN